jgi:hypothetical protein
MASPEHIEILRQGVKIWNAWRTSDSLIRLNLIGADLPRAELQRGAPPSGLQLAEPQRGNLFRSERSGSNIATAT